MDTVLTSDVLQDEMAVAVARILAVANLRARECGVDTQNRLITISQTENGDCWRVNYGAKDYVGKRGGDLLIDVGARDILIRRVLHGQ